MTPRNANAAAQACGIELPLSVTPSLRYPDRLLRMSSEIAERLKTVPRRIRHAYAAEIAQFKRSGKTVRLCYPSGGPKDSSIVTIPEILVLRVVEGYFRAMVGEEFSLPKLLELSTSTLRQQRQHVGLEISGSSLNRQRGVLTFCVRQKVTRNGIPDSFQFVHVRVPILRSGQRQR